MAALIVVVCAGWLFFVLVTIFRDGHVAGCYKKNKNYFGRPKVGKVRKMKRTGKLFAIN